MGVATRGSANLVYSKTMTSFVPSYRLHAESTTEVPAKKNLLLQVYIVQWEFHRLRILQCRQIVVGGCKVNCSIHGRCTLTSTMESQVITFKMPFLRLSVISNSIATISIYIFRYT